MKRSTKGPGEDVTVAATEPGGSVSAAALAPGLHFVATPIGTARDITLRALDTLRAADVIAAEDTMTAKRLMELHAIPIGGRPVLAYHDHNGAKMRPRLLSLLRDGQRVAYVSDAGTPLVADPGYRLAQAAIEADIPVTSAPGPSAVLAALTVSGLPSDRFLFAGFPPPQATARRAWLQSLDKAEATIVMFESPKRVHRLLDELCDVLGEDRQAAVCRELTKKFEDIRRGELGTLRTSIAQDTLKGECVVVIDRPGARVVAVEDVEAALRLAIAEGSVKSAATEIANAFQMPRRDVYQMALRLNEENRDD